MVPGLLPIFLHSCEIKSGTGLGTRLHSDCIHTAYIVKKLQKVNHTSFICLAMYIGSVCRLLVGIGLDYRTFLFTVYCISEYRGPQKTVIVTM